MVNTHLAKVNVVSSNLIARSILSFPSCMRSPALFVRQSVPKYSAASVPAMPSMLE